MKNKPIVDYIKRLDTTSEFEYFLDQLSEKDAEKLLAIIKKTEKYGISIAARNQWVKKLETNLYEVRSKVSSTIQRVYYFHVIENRSIITHGFAKKTDKIPESEKKCAREIRTLFMEEEKMETTKVSNYISRRRAKGTVFNEAFIAESERLEIALALRTSRENEGLTQRQ